jgi:hypothetical protein
MEMGAVGHGRTNVTVTCNTRSWGLDEQCWESRPEIACHVGFRAEGLGKYTMMDIYSKISPYLGTTFA